MILWVLWSRSTYHERQELFKATAAGPLAFDVSSPIISLRNVELRSWKRITFKSPTASKEC